MKINKIIIGMLVISLLFTSTLSVIGTSNQATKINEIRDISNYNIEPLISEDITMTIKPAQLFIGVNLEITNNGVETKENLEWSFRSKAAISGTGIFMREKLIKGSIGEIQPNETITIKFRPLNIDTPSPIGFGNMYMNASIQFDNYSIRTQQRAMILFFFLLSYKETYMDIKPPEAYSKYLNNTFDLIIDVVGLNIYDLGHLPGAVNYVWADGTLNEKIAELDPSWTYLVYCHTDPPSTASAQAMVDAGFENIYRLEGNFAAWKDGGYPIET